MSILGGPIPLPIPVPPPKASAKKTPQETLADFWSKFNSKHPGKVTSIFPRSLYSTSAAPIHPRGLKSARNAAESYEAAAKECRAKVDRIVRECERTNEKFTDPDFDIEHDENNNCLNGLVRGGGVAATGNIVAPPPAVSPWELKSSLDTLAQSQMLGPEGRVAVDVGALGRFLGGNDEMFPGGVGDGESYNPGSVHRVDWIFTSPQFTVNGFSGSDIKQGANGDCWWLAAVATIAHRRDIMDRICVRRNEECGVYGFVFQRDGLWASCVIDDNLYLSDRDFDFYGDVYDSTGKRAKKHRKENQTGSEALYFARCEDPNETWLPLLEKAYAKFHGDYDAISGGWPGEAVEDMTGGVTTTIAANRVLRKDKLWRELVNSDGEFVFSLAAMGTGWDNERSGLALGHAYSILEAREELSEDGSEKKRLVKIRNPWGERTWYGLGEWNGPWSDGSKEWTPYWLKKMGHTFGDDGIFWMEYKDMLETFMFLHRTRLFDERWTVVQQWTSTNVSWLTGYLETKFEIEVKKAGNVVIVLTQLDDRFFRGLEGQYRFELHFILQKKGAETGDDICRVRPVHKWENRSVSCEVELEPGVYEVLPKIAATRNDRATPVEDVVREYADKNPQKLRQVGMQYDLAHAKGGVPDEDDVLEKKKLERKKKEEEQKKKHRAKYKKAIGKTAKAMEKAAEALKEIADDKKGTATGTKEESKKPETEGEKASEAKGDTDKSTKANESPEATKLTEEVKPSTATAAESKPSTGPQSTATEGKDPKPGDTSAKAEDAATKDASTEAGASNDAPKEAKEGEEKAQDKEEAKEEEKAEEDEDESFDSDSDSDPDSDANDTASPASPWNAVAVLGLRVYARDPDVSISLVQPTERDEKSALTVEGQPAGATM